MTRFFLIVLLLSFFNIKDSWAQAPTSASASLAMPMEDHKIYILSLIERMKEAGKGELRDSLNRRLGHELIIAMSKDEKMEHSFDTLDMMSKLTSDDKSLRVFTWELENSDDEIRYFGIIQFTQEDDQLLSTLSDSSYVFVDDAQYTSLNARRWYGAMYYELKGFAYKGEKHYILFGINRNEDLIKKKVIEIVSVEKDIIFGKDVFNLENEKGIQRKIYQYAVDADMSIWFDEQDEDLIVMDHLSPLKPMYEGKFEYYAPDLSFDAFEFKKGRWNLIEDYDAKRGKRLNDRFYEMELPEEKKVY